ncbi:hypothetical protein KL86APRO_12443 [uncultured Alphaproteobacteria bacterium]|uniref:Uncharacterized protein n=1 Tax=uncultured Alphaproteobacteria bacterium TaxID=91750 RepID=A0A212KAL8_9PROT|nr:hypothetical protein KL86APRO_12443 [uncultured Alphaproteobacteria bacterium]
MKERHKELYRRFSQAALPVACAAIAWLAAERAEYKERLYQETPSIPFQPFCDEGGNWGDIRPIRGVAMSKTFRKELLRAMAWNGTTVHIADRYRKAGRSGPNPHPILVTPELYNRSSTMIRLTRDAWNAVKGTSSVSVEIDGKEIEKPPEPSLLCKDIEGKVKEL